MLCHAVVVLCYAVLLTPQGSSETAAELLLTLDVAAALTAVLCHVLLPMLHHVLCHAVL
jgi:hypothetical protein